MMKVTKEVTMGENVQASAVVTTSATTREMTVTAQPGVVYHVAELGGLRYSVVPHPPERRDQADEE